MMTRTTSHSRAIVELAHVCAAPMSAAERAAAALAPLSRLIAFDAHWIAVLDPLTQDFSCISIGGHTEQDVRYLSGPVRAEIARLRLGAAPLRLAESAPRSSPLISHLWPAGYADCVLATLATVDGRMVGALALSSEAPSVTDERVAALAGALPLLAEAVDPLRDASAMTRLVPDADAAVLLGEDGRTAQLTGAPSRAQLRSASPVIREAVRHLDHLAGSCSFVVPEPVPNETARITVVRAPSGTPARCVGIVIASPMGDVHGLTRRELEILGFVLEGWSNTVIARELVLAPRTVATHVEHILDKLNVLTRGRAAVLAERQGSYIPLSLSVRR